MTRCYTRILLLLLAAALLACARADAAPAPKKGGAPKRAPAAGSYRPQPEVFWVTVLINGRRVGFGRGQYTKGEGAPYQFQNLMLFRHAGMQHALRDWWEFNGDLRPANFFQKVLSWKGGQSLVNTVDGVFHYDKKKLKVEYNQFKTVENVEVPIPSRVMARFTQNLYLCRQKMQPGRVFTFKVYDVKGRRFAVQTYKVISWDASQKAWKLEITSEEAPGSVGTAWFQTATPEHPNGYVLRAVTPGAEKTQIETRAATREQAIQGFEKEAASLGI